VMMVEAFDAWNQQKQPFDYARFFTANHNRRQSRRWSRRRATTRP